MKLKHVHHLARKGVDFSVLLFLLATGFLGLIYFQHQPTEQILVLAFLAILYVFWGANNHYHNGDLTIEVILEYIAMAVIGSLLLATILL